MVDCPDITANPFTSGDHENDLIIQMVATGKYLIFRDGIDSFDRSYNISWDSVNVYGRQDAIQTYQSTGETINLSFPLKPGDTPDVFNMQLEALLALGKFARPLYSDKGQIKESPILKIRYRNLIVEDLNKGVGTPLWIAPTSISINYGDRARNVIAPDSKNRKLIVPKRISVSLGGAIINVEERYYKEGNLDKKRANDLPPTTQEQVEEVSETIDQVTAQVNAALGKLGGLFGGSQ